MSSSMHHSVNAGLKNNMEAGEVNDTKAYITNDKTS
jgi:hypothetical protein